MVVFDLERLRRKLQRVESFFVEVRWRTYVGVVLILTLFLHELEEGFEPSIDLFHRLLCDLAWEYVVVPVVFQLVVGIVIVEVLAVVEVVLSHFVECFVVEVFREMAEAPQYLVLVCVESSKVLLERLNYLIILYVRIGFIFYGCLVFVGHIPSLLAHFTTFCSLLEEGVLPSNLDNVTPVTEGRHRQIDTLRSPGGCMERDVNKRIIPEGIIAVGIAFLFYRSGSGFGPGIDTEG
jgi:hypothetical protein